MHEDLRDEFERMRAERQELREALAKLEKFEETAKAVEDGLLTLALAAKGQTTDQTNNLN